MTVRPETLRNVTSDEVGPLADLWHDGWQIGHAAIVPKALLQFRRRAHFRARIMDSLDACYVTGPVGDIHGFVRIKGAELDQFYVAPDQIGTGAAARLMTAAECLLRNLGIRETFLIASVGNDRAVRFYEKMGWVNYGTHREGVETADGPFQMDVIRFEKTL